MNIKCFLKECIKIHDRLVITRISELCKLLGLGDVKCDEHKAEMIPKIKKSKILLDWDPDWLFHTDWKLGIVKKKKWADGRSVYIYPTPPPRARIISHAGSNLEISFSKTFCFTETGKPSQHDCPPLTRRWEQMDSRELVRSEKLTASSRIWTWVVDSIFITVTLSAPKVVYTCGWQIEDNRKRKQEKYCELVRERKTL